MPNVIKKLPKAQNEIWAPNEQILLFVRRHWFTLWPAYLTVGLLILLIISFIVVFYSLGVDQFLVSINLAVSSTKIFWLIILMLILALDLFLFLSWMQYYLDITIVTNRRVIDIEQLSLFKRRIVAADLVSIQDVRAEVRGIFGTLLDLGTVFIQTAGEAPNFELRDLPHPSSMVRQITSISSDVLTQAPQAQKSVYSESDLETHEQEFAQIFKGAKEENEYLAPEEQVEIAEMEKLDNKVKLKEETKIKRHSSKIKKKSHKIKTEISHNKNKGEIDF